MIGDQILRTNVTCFAHPVNGFPPDPCRGEVMLHNASGDVVTRGSYDLQPGQSTSLIFRTPADEMRHELDPCFMPAPGGRAVPNVEVVDGVTGNTMFLINPAAARMSEFQRP